MQLLKKYKHIFGRDLADVGIIPGAECTIPLITDAKPFVQDLYAMSDQHKDEIKRQCKLLLDANLIRVSHGSPFCSSPTLAKKADGTWRLAIDYRRLNYISVTNTRPTPNITNSIKALAGKEYYTIADCRSGYFHVQIKESDKWKTAFTDGSTLYEWNVMPFGFKNASGLWQSIMNETYDKCPNTVVHYDD